MCSPAVACVQAPCAQILSVVVSGSRQRNRPSLRSNFGFAREAENHIQLEFFFALNLVCKGVAKVGPIAAAIMSWCHEDNKDNKNRELDATAGKSHTATEHKHTCTCTCNCELRSSVCPATRIRSGLEDRCPCMLRCWIPRAECQRSYTQ
jgi:hypothetical protein